MLAKEKPETLCLVSNISLNSHQRQGPKLQVLIGAEVRPRLATDLQVFRPDLSVFAVQGFLHLEDLCRRVTRTILIPPPGAGWITLLRCVPKSEMEVTKLD